ncbi:MAG: hypothetical protein V3R64_05695, partial [Sphingomonadales bacterium]
MVWEIIEALFAVALPLGILSYLLVSWSIKTGRLSGEGDHKSQRAEIKAMRKAQKVKKTKTKNPIHNKWLKFGGRFYGAVGLYTFLIIEIREVVDFINGYESVEATMATLGNSSLIGTVISFFVNSLMNFIWAIAWVKGSGASHAATPKE